MVSGSAREHLEEGESDMIVTQATVTFSVHGDRKGISLARSLSTSYGVRPLRQWSPVVNAPLVAPAAIPHVIDRHLPPTMIKACMQKSVVTVTAFEVGNRRHRRDTGIHRAIISFFPFRPPVTAWRLLTQCCKTPRLARDRDLRVSLPRMMHDADYLRCHR